MNMDARPFLNLVKELRNAQREYFFTRSYATLQKAKALEKRVDNQISIIEHTLANDKFTQMEFSFDVP